MSFKNNTMEWLQMKDRAFKYLREELSIEYYPNLDQIEYTLHVSTIRDKSIFYSVLVYLEEYKVILPLRCENGIERIFPHPSLELNEIFSLNNLTRKALKKSLQGDYSENLSN